MRARVCIDRTELMWLPRTMGGTVDFNLPSSLPFTKMDNEHQVVLCTFYCAFKRVTWNEAQGLCDVLQSDEALPVCASVRQIFF